MIVFQDEFMKLKGRHPSFYYNGKKIILSDSFRIPKGRCRLRLRFISTNSEWKQGVSINVKGNIFINNQIISKGISLWEHTAPREVLFETETKDGNIIIFNEWQNSRGIIHSGHNGAAMYFEEIPGGKRYYCNDGHPNDDFTDLIFELTLV